MKSHTSAEGQSQDLNPILSSFQYLLLRTTRNLMPLAAQGPPDKQSAFRSRDKNETKSSPTGSEESPAADRPRRGTGLWRGDSTGWGLGSSSQAPPCLTCSESLPLRGRSFFTGYFRI